MGPLVVAQVSVGSEGNTALLAKVGFYAQVNALVDFKVAPLGKIFLANVALEGLDTQVGPMVNFEAS
jgi:hypothetical protein